MRPLRVFLAPAEDADGISSPADPRLTPIDLLQTDPRGNGFSFRVPRVFRGDYVTFTYCKPCAQMSAGRTLLPTGPFLPATFHVVGDSGPPVLTIALAAALGISLVAVGALGVARRRP
jgi:hypothetical protein